MKKKNGVSFLIIMFYIIMFILSLSVISYCGSTQELVTQMGKKGDDPTQRICFCLFTF